jgi:hypothetical protein
VTEDAPLRIDAYCHFVADHPDFVALVEEFDLQIVNQTFHHDPKFGQLARRHSSN